MKHVILILAVVLALPSTSSAEKPYQKLRHDSRLLEKQEEISLLLPPGYHDPASHKRRYPVIFFAQSGGGITENFLRLMQQGVLPPMIVVASDVGAHTKNGDSAWSDKVAPSESWLIQELMPWLESNYRIQEERPQYVVIGQSKGGGGALHLAIKYPDRFAAAVSLDGAIPMYDSKGAALPGESFAELIKDRGEQVRDLPILLVAGGWFTKYADEYGKKLPGLGMTNVQRLDVQQCGHSGACMVDNRGPEIATLFLNGLHQDTWSKPAPPIQVGDAVSYQLSVDRPVKVTIGSPSRDQVSTTRFTLDGTLPNANSPFAEGPVEVGESTVIWAQNFEGDRPVSPLAVARVQVFRPIASVEVGAKQPQGWRLSWWKPDSDPNADPPAGQRRIANLPYESEKGLAEKKGPCRLRALIEVPNRGIYRFDLHEDKLQMSVGKDVPPAGTRNHKVALESGLHPITIFGHARGDGQIRLRNNLHWTGPVKEGEVPASAIHLPVD